MYAAEPFDYTSDGSEIGVLAVYNGRRSIAMETNGNYASPDSTKEMPCTINSGDPKAGDRANAECVVKPSDETGGYPTLGYTTIIVEAVKTPILENNC